jgi:hypothetical protein
MAHKSKGILKFHGVRSAFWRAAKSGRHSATSTILVGTSGFPFTVSNMEGRGLCQPQDDRVWTKARSSVLSWQAKDA